MRRGWRFLGLGLVPITSLVGACLFDGLDSFDSGGTGGHPTSGAAGGPGSGGGTGPSSGGGGNGGGSSCDTKCDGKCVDLDTDPDHCGDCATACKTGYGCAKRTCGNVPVQVFAGPGVTCTLLAGGEVWCWGRDVWGEVGLDPALATTISIFDNDKCQPQPIHVDVPEPAVEVGVGSEFACARGTSGKIYCWGSNDRGHLGHDPASDATCTKAGGPNAGSMGPCSPTPKQVSLPAGVRASQLSVGSSAACIRSSTDDLYCWGDNGEGAIQSPVGGFAYAPTKNANVHGDVADVSVGQSAEGFTTVCIVRKGSGRVDCWGESLDAFFKAPGVAGCAFSTYGACDPAAHPVPQKFSDGSGTITADRVQVGYVSACATLGGAVTCWGNDEFGLSGDGNPNNSQFDPTSVPGLGSVSQLSLTFAVALGLDATGAVRGLGWNALGQVGDGTTTGTACPGAGGSFCIVTAKALAGLTGIASVSGGLQSSAAVTRGGAVLTWGVNLMGELGHTPGTGTDTDCGGEPCNPTPAPVAGLP